MASSYSVDDILAEIRQKKSDSAASADFASAPETVEEKPVEKAMSEVPAAPAAEPKPQKAEEPVIKRKLHIDEESLREYFGQNENIQKQKDSAEPEITEVESSDVNEFIPKDMTRHFEKIKTDETLENGKKSFTSVKGGFLGNEGQQNGAGEEAEAGTVSYTEEKAAEPEYTDKGHSNIRKFMSEVAEPTDQDIHKPLTPSEEGVKNEFNDKANREIAKELMQDMHEPDTDTDPEDFETREQTPIIADNLKKMYTGYVVRCGITFVLFLASLALCMAPVLGISLPEIIAFSKDNAVFPMVNLGIVLAAAVASHMAVGNGLLGLVKFRGGNDSFAALSVIGAAVLGSMYSVMPEAMDASGKNLFFPVVVLGLFFNNLGKAVSTKRVENNFNVLITDSEKSSLLPVHNKDLARELTGQIEGTPRFCTAVKAKFFTRFMDYSFREDVTDGIARVITPIVLIGAIADGAVSYILTKNIPDALVGLSAILIISAPLSSILAGALPVSRSCKALNEENAVLASGNIAESFAETDSVLLDIEDIFPAGSITLHGIKTFAKGRIDEAILDAASVICNTRSTLESIFMDVVQGDRKLLKPVDSIIYEDGMGLSAWVDGKRVLIGNRELMINHSIDIPSHDYENKYVGSGKDILYLANSGELTGMFVISYHAEKSVYRSLGIMAERNIKLVINCSDPNITAEKLSKLFDFPEENLKILSSKYQQKCAELTEERDNASAAAVYNGSLESLSDILSCSGIIRQSSFAAALVEIIAIVLGFILVTFYLFTGNIASLAMYIILAYQLFWLLADLLIILLRKRI